MSADRFAACRDEQASRQNRVPQSVGRKRAWLSLIKFSSCRLEVCWKSTLVSIVGSTVEIMLYELTYNVSRRRTDSDPRWSPDKVTEKSTQYSCGRVLQRHVPAPSPASLYSPVYFCKNSL